MPAIRRIQQQRQLLLDGIAALAAINAGKTAGDVALTFPGSRARMYRAINAAMQDDAVPQTNRRASDMADSGIDPLLS